MLAQVLGLASPARGDAAVRETASRNPPAIEDQHGGGASAGRGGGGGGEQAAFFAGAFIAHPKISTGAGDHFNAGFCLGRVLGLGLEESLCAVAGPACSSARGKAPPPLNWRSSSPPFPSLKSEWIDWPENLPA